MKRTHPFIVILHQKLTGVCNLELDLNQLKKLAELWRVPMKEALALADFMGYSYVKPCLRDLERKNESST